MAHFEKYTKAGTWQVLEHDKHTREGKHIDKTKTPLNYNLQENRADPWQFVKDKIVMSKKKGFRFNSRSVACVSCIITLPKDFRGDERLFFEKSKAFLDSVFGADNCISAWVHKDEQNPHLHYKFCPITKEGQFNAKKLINRKFLQRFHPRLEEELFKVFGYAVGIENGATTKGNQTIQQLKALAEAKQEFDLVMSELAKAKATLERTLQLKDIASRELKETYKLIEEAEGRLAKLKKECFTFENEDFSPMFDDDILR